MQGAKQFCFIIRRAPDDGFRTGELLDMAMTAAAFDQPVSVVFMDDGVLHLLAGQQQQKSPVNIIQMIAAFDLYDLDHPWVETESLWERGLTLAALAVPVRSISRSGLGCLLARQHILLAG
jgi:tRNA 2-thiouridine synthesizing protein C